MVPGLLRPTLLSRRGKCTSVIEIAYEGLTYPLRVGQSGAPAPAAGYRPGPPVSCRTCPWPASSTPRCRAGAENTMPGEIHKAEVTSAYLLQQATKAHADADAARAKAYADCVARNTALFIGEIDQRLAHHRGSDQRRVPRFWR